MSSVWSPIGWAPHLRNTRISWKGLLLWCSTSSTCRDMACPGHRLHVSRNQPSRTGTSILSSARSTAPHTNMCPGQPIRQRERRGRTSSSVGCFATWGAAGSLVLRPPSLIRAHKKKGPG